MINLEKQEINEYLGKSHIGFWRLELEDGMAVRMYTDTLMQELMGVSSDITPEECCEFFTCHIHPDDIHLTAAYLEELMRGDAEIIYRYLHPLKGEIRVRCGGRCIRNEGSLATVAGYHREYTDVFHLEDDNEKEQWLIRRNRDLQEDRNSEAEYNRSITDRAACGIVYYKLPLRNDLYMNEEALRVYGVGSLDDARVSADRIMRRVSYNSPADMQKLQKLITSDGAVDYGCTITGENGIVSSILAHTEVITTAKGERTVYTTFLDISENESLRNEKNILNALCQDFKSFFYLDFENETITIIKANDEARIFIEPGKNIAGFEEYRRNIRDCFDNFIDKESASDFLQVLDPINLKARLLKKRKMLYRFATLPRESKQYHIEISGSFAGESGRGAVIGFRLINEIIEQEEKRRRELKNVNQKLEEQLHTIGGLSNAYFAVYWVDIVANSSKAVKSIPFFEDAVKECMTTDDITSAFINLCVQPEDRERMLAFTNWRNIEKLLDGNDVIVEEFHGMIKPWEWCRASWIVAARDDDETVTSLLFSVEDISHIVAEQKRREEEHKLLDEQTRVISALSLEYATVWLISDNGQTSVNYRDNGSSEIARESVFFAEKKQSYTDSIYDYMSKYVCEEDQENFACETQYEVVLHRIRQQAIYSVVYKRNYNGKQEFFQISYTAAGGDESNDFIMGFKNVNNLVVEERKRNETLTEALAAAEYANRAKTQFLNNMSHDIRTPMNAIIGFTSLAASHIDNKDKVKEYLRKIGTSSEHLLSLINDVLDMSRIESGKVKIEEKPLHLPDLLHDIRTIIQPTVTSKQLDFLIDTVDVVDEDVFADKMKLTQVLLNILGNGVKFNKTGGLVSLRVRQEKKAPKGCAKYHFVIRDTGIGISDEFKEHIFESFSRAESTTVSRIQGTGLGLAITKNIVEMMGGSISLKSEEGVGSEFDVCLTFRLTGERKVYKKMESLQGLRVLVADDDTDTCLSISSMLSEIGMRSEWTVSGKEAVIRAKHAMQMCDEFYAYIIDWMMPDMNGIEAVRRIRKVIGDDKPIIILTAYDWSDVEEEAREAGVTAFCEKPLFMSELRDILSRPVVDEPKKQTKPEFSAEGKNILLVEDNELNQEIAVEILKEAGFNVEVALDGAVAVEKMQNAEDGQYDLILMDIQMPVMNGYEATRQIRSMDSQYCREIPILAMTANAFEEDRQSAFEAGMNDHLAKPINIETLFKVLCETLG